MARYEQVQRPVIDARYLGFEDDFAAPAAKANPHLATPDTMRAQASGNIGGGILSREPEHDRDAETQAMANDFRRVRLENKRVINGSASDQPPPSRTAQQAAPQVACAAPRSTPRRPLRPRCRRPAPASAPGRSRPR